MKMWNQTFRSDGRGVDKADDMEQIIVYAQRGREADRIKAAIKRAVKSTSRAAINPLRPSPTKTYPQP